MSSPFQLRGTLWFTAGNSGWTESYYLNGPDYSTGLTQLSAIASARLALLQLSCSIVHAIVSNIYVRGDAFFVGSAVGPGTFPTETEYMPPDYALQVTWQGGAYARNRTFLRGFPLNQQTDGAYTPTSGFTTAFGTYENAVISNCYLRQYVPNPTPPPAMVYQFNAVLVGTIKVLLARRKTGRPFGLPRGRLVAP
jgi:hypothetical protein